MTKEMNRREFLKLSGMTLLATGLGGFLLKELLSKTGVAAIASGLTGSSPAGSLVVVQLSGGNDGLNTVIPYSQGAYYDARPHIGIQQADVLKLDDQFGLHPNMQDLQQLYQAGQVAIIHGVGYPNPILSHFRSMAVWHTADPTVRAQTGWLGRYLDSTWSKSADPLRAINLGTVTPLALGSQKSDVPSIIRPASYRLAVEHSNWWDPVFASAARNMYNGTLTDDLSFVREEGQQMYQGMDEVALYAGKLKPSSGYPENPLASQLEVVAGLLGAGVPTKVFYTQMGGFDDHAGEESHHGTTLGDFSSAVGAFMRDIKKRGLQDKVTILAFSEFGRRVKENGSMGTDHGEAGPVFLVGANVKGGMYGQYPSLQKTHQGDLSYTVDFRSVYATALEHVLQVNPKDVLGASFETLPVFV
jgi:uncharacterized protein (DUF1501 family)